MSQFTAGTAGSRGSQLVSFTNPIAPPGMGPLGSLEGAHRTVTIKSVLDNVLERLHGEFDTILEQGPALSDADRSVGSRQFCTRMHLHHYHACCSTPRWGAGHA